MNAEARQQLVDVLAEMQLATIAMLKGLARGELPTPAEAKMVAELGDLAKQLVLLEPREPNSLPFIGSNVTLGEDVAPGSERDRSNQRLSNGFRGLAAEVGAQLEKAS